MPDTQPNNFARVNPDGTVTAVFPGGVEILAGIDGTPPNERQVRWVRESDGSMVANILVYDAGAAQLNMGVQGSPPSEPAYSSWFAQGGDNAASAEINLNAPPGGGGASQISIVADNGPTHTAQRTLLDSNGASDYVRSVTTGALLDRRMEVGRIALPWIGGTRISGQVTILHDLGVVPTGVWLSGVEQGTASNFAAFVVKSRTASQVDFWGYNIDQVPGANFNSTVAYVLIG